MIQWINYWVPLITILLITAPIWLFIGLMLFFFLQWIWEGLTRDLPDYIYHRRREAEREKARRIRKEAEAQLSAQVKAAADQLQREYSFRRAVADELVRREQG